MPYKNPKLTVDGVILKDDSVVLVRRKNDPFKGSWALPGGFVEYGETVEDAVKREILEETGLAVKVVKLVGVYSDPERDPRGHTITVAFLCRETSGSLQGASDAVEAIYHPLRNLPPLAFDHKKIIKDALNSLQNGKQAR